MSSIAKEPLKMAMLGQDHQNLFQDQNRDPVHDQGQDYQRKILVGLHLEGPLPDVLLLDGQHQCGQDLEIGTVTRSINNLLIFLFVRIGFKRFNCKLKGLILIIGACPILILCMRFRTILPNFDFKSYSCFFLKTS